MIRAALGSGALHGVHLGAGNALHYIPFGAVERLVEYVLMLGVPVVLLVGGAFVSAVAAWASSARAWSLSPGAGSSFYPCKWPGDIRGTARPTEQRNLELCPAIQG